MQGGPQHGPVMVINQGSKRETGREAQLGNIAAGKAIADIIRTTLGPRSMLKMLLDAMGGIVMTNDGNCKNKNNYVIGHDIGESNMRQCFK